MSLVFTVFEQVLIMLFLMVVGFFCYQRKLISAEGNRDLSSLLIYIVNPALVLMSYQNNTNRKLLFGLFVSMGLTTLGLLLFILLSKVLVPQKSSEYAIERLAATYSNCGFIGIPIVNGVFGTEGVFYLTAVLTIFNLFLWTQGISLIKGNTGEKISPAQMLKNIFNPVIIAALIGFTMFLLQLHFPAPVAASFNFISGMNTPLAMMIAGIILAQSDLKKLLINKRIYYISFLRLILYPALLLVIFHFIPVSRVILLSVTLSLACPVASSVPAFALRFGKNSIYASEILAVSTLLSIASLPVVMLLYTVLNNILP